MPSFTRRIPSSAPPPLPTLIKTGVPSLDDLFHLPPSSTTAIFSPDVHSSWPRLISRYFIAQAFLSSEEVVIVGDESSGRDLVKGCMWIDERSTAGKEADSASEGEGEGGGGGDENRTRIAWRYGGMEKFKTSVGEKGQLNLSTSVPKDLLSQAEKGGHLRYIDSGARSGGVETGHSVSSSSSKSWTKLASILTEIQTVLGKLDGRTTTRIIIDELGGAQWDEPSTHEVHRFLHGLRSLVRGRNVVAMVTFPPTVVRTLGEEGIKRLSWAVDASLELKGFADDPTLQPIFHPLHGLITLHSFPHTQLLPPTIKHSSLLGLSAGGGGSENNLGFRARRKRWGVETVHLGVEGGVGERRTEPAPEVARMVKAAPPAQSEGVERVAVPPTPQEVPTADDVAVSAPPAKKEKKARVRFGGDEVMVDSSSGPRPGHDEHGHGDRGHSHTPRVAVRHDRPDLYEF